MKTRNFSFAAVGLMALAVVGLSACRQNPYPDLKGGTLQPSKPQEPWVVAPPFSVEMDSDTLEFTEGQTGVYKLVGHVPNGNPVVTFSGLPTGATYDPKNGELKWTPDFSAGSDPQDPTVQSRTYKVTGKVRSDLDPVTSNDFGFLIVVKNVPREFRFNVISGQVFHLKEGVAYKQTLKLVNADFPNGGFRVSSKNLPLGATLAVDPVTPTDITLSFTPPVGFTQLRKNGAAYAPRCQLTNLYCETVEVELAATDPAGEMTVTKIKWEIEDVRQSPQLVAPDNVADDLDVTLYLTATDLNAEVAPVLSLEGMAPFGTLTFKDVTAASGGTPAFSSVTEMRWTDIPADKLGTTQILKVKACAYSTPTTQTQCTTKVVNVNLAGGAHKAPEVDRAKWAFTDRLFFKVGDTVRVPLPVKDAEGNPLAPSVRVEPASAGAEVKWQADELVVTPKTAGLKQFIVTATSAFGVVNSQGFMFEALPANWSSVLIVGDPLRNKEVDAWKTMAGGGDVVSPEAALDERTLALRRVMIVTTTALDATESLPALEAAAATVPSVVIASPLLGSLNSGLATEMTTLGVIEKGRFSNLGYSAPGNWNLKSGIMPVGYSRPINAVSLTGTLTSESDDPMSLDLKTGSSCKKVMTFSTAAGQESVELVRCERGGGKGAMVVIGFEPGDLKFTGTDSALPAKWFKELAL